MGTADVTALDALVCRTLHGAHVTSRRLIQCDVPNSRNYGRNLNAKVSLMLGRTIQLHQDAIHNVTLMYRPEVTDELELSVRWLRDQTTIMLTEGEMLDLAEKLVKGVKKMRKHKAKLARQGRIHTDPVPEFIKHGRRR